jgi:hypothetical protein
VLRQLNDIRLLLKGNEKASEQPQETEMDPEHWWLSLNPRLKVAPAYHGNAYDIAFPDSMEKCYALVQIFFTNVDPMIRIVHQPTVRSRLEEFMRSRTSGARISTPESDYSISNFEPLLWVIFYAAIYSMRPADVVRYHSQDKRELLLLYRRAAQHSLERAHVLSTTSIEVLQALVLLLVSLSRKLSRIIDSN